MSPVTPESIGRLTDLTDGQWNAHGAKWERMGRVVLFHEAGEWAAVELMK